MDVTGTLHKIFPGQHISDTFKKKEFVVMVAENPEYPEYIKFELIQDKVTLLEQYKEGDEITVAFNLKGRPYTNSAGEEKFFNNLHAWKVSKNEGSTPGEQGAYPTKDDIPF